MGEVQRAPRREASGHPPPLGGAGGVAGGELPVTAGKLSLSQAGYRFESPSPSSPLSETSLPYGASGRTNHRETGLLQALEPSQQLDTTTNHTTTAQPKVCQRKARNGTRHKSMVCRSRTVAKTSRSGENRTSLHWLSASTSWRLPVSHTRTTDPAGSPRNGLNCCGSQLSRNGRCPQRCSPLTTTTLLSVDHFPRFFRLASFGASVLTMSRIPLSLRKMAVHRSRRALD